MLPQNNGRKNIERNEKGEKIPHSSHQQHDA